VNSFLYSSLRLKIVFFRTQATLFLQSSHFKHPFFPFTQSIFPSTGKLQICCLHLQALSPQKKISGPKDIEIVSFEISQKRIFLLLTSNTRNTQKNIGSIMFSNYVLITSFVVFFWQESIVFFGFGFLCLAARHHMLDFFV